MLSFACACWGAAFTVASADWVAHWDFNEGMGQTTVDLVGDIAGELQGNATWVTGRTGNGVQFKQDATSQVYVGTDPALNLTEAVSITAWVRPEGSSNYGVIAGIDKGGGAADDQFVLKTTASASSALTFQITDTAGRAITATDTVSIVERAQSSADGWLHVAAVFTPGQSVALYVNGSQVAYTATSVNQMQSKLSESVPFRIGNMTGSTNYGFNGIIDEVRVYDNPLDAATIVQMAAGEEGGDGEAGAYLFSFGAVADPQYKDAPTAGSRHYRKTLEKLPVMVDDFNARDLEFVISLGDFIDAGFESFTPLMQIWNELEHPSYHVVGNHDLSIGSYTLADVIEVMGIPSSYYSFASNGWRFLVLDGNDAGYGIHSAEQLAWARDNLDQALADQEPVIIFDHYPVYPAGTPHISPQAGVLLALVDDYPNVRAWMNGHNHAGAYGLNKGVHYLNLQGMVETENTTAYAEVQVWEDRIEVLGEGREPNRTLSFPLSAATALTAPQDFTATDGGSGIRLEWSAYAVTDAEGLLLERRTAGVNEGYTVVATLPVAESTYLDTAAPGGVLSVYRLRAVSDEGDASPQAALTHFQMGFLSGQIANLTATAGEGNAIVLSWNLDGGSYDRLVLERRLGDSGAFVVVSDTLPGDATGYTDTGLAPNTGYTYRVAGVSGERQTQWSDAGTAQSGSAGGSAGEAPGLVAYWPFDEGSGTVAGDYSGNGSSGALVGNTVWAEGKIGGALAFAGDSESQVLVGTPEILNINSAVTVMAWVKPSGTSNYGVIAGVDLSGGTANDQYVLKTTTSSSFQLTYQVTANGQGYSATDSLSLTARAAQTEDGWVHVAGVFTPGQSVELYVNGERVAQNSLSIETLQRTMDASRPFRIGNMSGSSNYGFKGAIDEVRVFAASVSAQDIATYAAGELIYDPNSTRVIDSSHVWKYLDDGSDQGAAWYAVGFDDSGWQGGPSQLGYGDGDEATVISYGADANNKHPAYYFRTTFDIEDAADYGLLLFEVLRDDGVILYLNGHEIIRDNMPASGVDYRTYSSTTIDGSAENVFHPFQVPVEHLVSGTNVLAAQVHNRSASSSDISFDLKLTLQAAPDPNAPVFASPRIEATHATIASGYAFNLADYVSDANGDALVFTKISGPEWLTIAEDGTVSGMPGLAHLGVNEFVVHVTDNNDGSATAIVRIVVEEGFELARAPLPGGEGVLRFGIVPDTQGATNGVPTEETRAVAEQLLLQRPDFAIHVGDVTDGNRVGDAKMVELNYFNTLLTHPLRDAGILLYPIRGNHDAQVHTLTSNSVSAWQEAFPHLFSGDTAVVDPANVPGGSAGSPNYNNYSYVFNPAPNTYLIALDMWQGGSHDNYSDWVAAQMAAIRTENPDAHIFGYSHSGLFSSSSHAAMVEYIGSPDAFIAAGKLHGIDGWFSGHNHIFDRSMAIDADNGNNPAFFNITVGSASSKFYGLSRNPVQGQHINRMIDSTRIDGRPIAYQMVEVNGSFVTVSTYMSPKNTEGGFNDWTLWDELVYSSNGQQFTVAAGADYNARNIVASAPQADGYVGTALRIIDGVNSNTSAYTHGSNSFELYRNISVGWWPVDAWHEDDSRQIVSDVVSIHGMRESSKVNRADAYTLVMAFDKALSPWHRNALSIVAFLDEDLTDETPGAWVDAVQATLATPASEPVFRAPTEEDVVGTWGIDLEAGEVWARLDYQGDFAIASNVVDTDADGLADEWELLHFGTLAYGAQDDPDGDGLTNLQEQSLSTNPTLADTDGDLINDGIEYASGLDPLTPDTVLTDSILAVIRANTTLQGHFGLYTQDALGALSGEPLLEVTPDSKEAVLRLRVQESADLEHWDDIANEVILTIPITQQKQFFRFIAR